MPTCLPDVTITQVADAPCCAWKVVQTYPCAHRLYNLYTNGQNAVLLHHPVRVEELGGGMYFLKDAYNSHVTIDFGSTITVNDTQITNTEDEENAVLAPDFAAYLRNTIFCCQCHTQQNSPQYRCYPVDEEGNIIIPETP